ncbi:hypothetical protein E1265_05755 [Streptomyces sp. 8K308]|uniref:hypothetical protein n=1 Tax=Streptomyces sp. 8K308 TaxID=2530388 RepID=UPI00104B371A|nr:hypothetical protein [Streptomyces sp. 8K308]TDC25881.1 hypothetical protein E1265_05755 [Streptomyces sp. 8K308]
MTEYYQPIESITVNAATLQRGDIITIGGQPFVVRDLVSLHGGAKRLEFLSGDALTVRWNTILKAARPYRRPARPKR